MKFENMNIQENVLGSLNNIGFKEPTKIQSETIPIIKQGYDVIGQSKTGSGKTAAFGIPLVEKVTKGTRAQALVLAPTRELAKQIASEIRKFSDLKGLSVQTVYGGVSMRPQIMGLKNSEIIVGTPGRILDHMRRGNFDTKNVKMFVLDEADRMIDMGFIDDIAKIENNLPDDRQTLLFSATMPRKLNKITSRFTENAKRIKTETKVDEGLLEQHYCDVKPYEKFSLLVHLMKEEDPELAIIFCKTRRETSAVASNLKKQGINAEAIHGGLSQHQREKALKKFHDGRIRFLVATDVASRGIDVDNISHIFNYRLPSNAEDYVNRIGRTARAGKSGKVISLLSKDDHASFRRIMEKYSYKVGKLEISDFKEIPFRKRSSKRRRSYKNYRRRR
ncbi:MAG: DEAD/DEAH box helicase [Candidatus Aenigmarchaeota archaeon]|nr:DEAD/DEAH box helicase [Candidatus Aenigmarchaeota archaeon]